MSKYSQTARAVKQNIALAGGDKTLFKIRNRESIN
jgi:hypothetical protein